MKKETEKPSAEAKALSLFLMALKSTNPKYKEQAKRMNKLWDRVNINRITKSDYDKEVLKTLTSYGGYSEVIEKTIRFYIKETGEWKSKGDDQYSLDAKEIAEKILNE